MYDACYENAAEISIQKFKTHLLSAQVLLAMHDANIDNNRVQRMFESLCAMPKRIDVYEE
ncbi:MAG: hypothetical protein Kow0099_07590 [Candidatus Abyssubacteria bacterium]